MRWIVFTCEDTAVLRFAVGVRVPDLYLSCVAPSDWTAFVYNTIQYTGGPFHEIVAVNCSSSLTRPPLSVTLSTINLLGQRKCFLYVWLLGNLFKIIWNTQGWEEVPDSLTSLFVILLMPDVDLIAFKKIEYLWMTTWTFTLALYNSVDFIFYMLLLKMTKLLTKIVLGAMKNREI